MKDHKKSYFVASAHDKSHGMYATNVRQLVTYYSDH